ncbi:MAG: hypothetical protein EHM19_04725 [Candidatus Latescibacterota bacterium]|nr:MAG: hypothetical protein EHM19_04725 [Candidatus Latescibacterota bacterium]
MAKRATITLAMAALLGWSAGAAAGTYDFTPTPADLGGLDHYYRYAWGFDVSSLAGMVILEAELVIEDITNYDNGENVLYIHLLDGAPLGLTSAWDNAVGGDAFAGQGPLIAEFHDTNGSLTREDLHYSFASLGILSTASVFAGDGLLAVGFDPDCHFWNEGVRLTVTAEPPSATEDASWGAIKILFR